LYLAIVSIIAAGLWWAWSRVVGSPVTRGVAAYGRGDWQEAGRLAQARLETARDDPGALRLLARAAARLGRLPEAESIYARLGPSDLEAEDFFLQGLRLSVSGQPMAAQEAHRKALGLDPTHAEALHMLGLATYQMGQSLEGSRIGEELARRPGWEARGYFLLGVCRASDHDAAGSAEALGHALELDPGILAVPGDPSSTRKLLARVLMQSGRPAQAREALEGATGAREDGEAQWLLSRAYLMEGKLPDAARALERSGTHRAENLIDPEPGSYVGEARCWSCHPDVASTVRTSRHARTYRGAGDLVDLPLPDHPVTDPHNPGVSHTMKRSDGKVVVETRVPDRILRAVVDYALGATDRYSALVGRDERGEARTIRLAYHHGPAGSGWGLMKGQPVFPRQVADYLGERYASEDARRECLVCHVTNPRAIREHTGPEAADRAIGCEKCHGPGSLHLAAVAARFPDLAISLPARASSADVNRSCAECHAQHFIAMPPTRKEAGWARFPSSTLPMSACYTRSGGNLSCTTCHDPHRDVETSAAHYEERCLSCHAASTRQGGAGNRQPDTSTAGPVSQEASAFRPPCPVNPNRDCVKCHMPKVPYDWLHGDFTDHYIRVHR
jgi:tetratricopeptide (TPR) repeat protein